MAESWSVAVAGGRARGRWLAVAWLAVAWLAVAAWPVGCGRVAVAVAGWPRGRVAVAGWRWPGGRGRAVAGLAGNLKKRLWANQGFSGHGRHDQRLLLFSTTLLCCKDTPCLGVAIGYIGWMEWIEECTNMKIYIVYLYIVSYTIIIRYVGILRYCTDSILSQRDATLCLLFWGVLWVFLKAVRNVVQLPCQQHYNYGNYTFRDPNASNFQSIPFWIPASTFSSKVKQIFVSKNRWVSG